MQRKKGFLRRIIQTALFTFLLLSSAQASEPLWTFEPQTPTALIVEKGSNAQIVYTVYNQSFKAKTLFMKPVTGITQSTPCHLTVNGKCTLTLNINGSALLGDVLGGPILCEQGNALQCYQPSEPHILRILLIDPSPQPPIEQFTITPIAGANGSIAPATTQVVNPGSSLTFTATPNSGFAVEEWLLDGNVVQSGGTSYQLENIQENHTLEVTFNQATLSPLTSNLTLSMRNPSVSPPLVGNPRIIRIENTGTITANNLQTSTTGLPSGTGIASTCTGTLNPGATCDITITPGTIPSLNASNVRCNATPGTEPVPTIVTVTADNASPANVTVRVLGYGCIYQGGFLFMVNDNTPNTQSISGKVVMLNNIMGIWGPNVIVGGISELSTAGPNSCDGKNDGRCNTDRIINAGLTPPVSAQTCVSSTDAGFNDWYLPAICELGRYTGLGADAGCGSVNPNVYSSLAVNNLGNFTPGGFTSSTEYSPDLMTSIWGQGFGAGGQVGYFKNNARVSFRCVRAFTS